LVAVAVHQHLVGDREQRQLQAPGLGLADQELLESNACALTLFAASSERSDNSSSRQRQQAARLPVPRSAAARGERRIGRHQPVELGAGIVDQSGREKRAPAAQWTLFGLQV